MVYMKHIQFWLFSASRNEKRRTDNDCIREE